MHTWDLSPREAAALQHSLAARVAREGDLPGDSVRLIAGADVAFDRQHGRACGAIVLLDYPSLEVVHRATVEAQVTFPYVPGLLSFRETPVLLSAFEQLPQQPDLLFVDGHGYAHPRRFGFACHVGLLLDLPTVGVAKSRLIGEHATVGAARGSRADLSHGGEVIGSLLRTRERVRPVYVSIGHRLSLAACERWALACARGYRVPEPTRLADRLAGEAKRRMLDATLAMVIEQRAGEEGRWEWEPDGDRVVFRHDMPPMPVDYGCSLDIINPADNELLDIMLIDTAGRSTQRHRGDREPVRVVDVLRRRDGDDKLIAVPLGAPRHVSDAVRERIWQWCIEMEKPVIGWGGEDAAIDLILQCRAATPRTHPQPNATPVSPSPVRRRGVGG